MKPAAGLRTTPLWWAANARPCKGHAPGGPFFSKCEQAAVRKMCVGVFGPSQSGKSYLISALASNAAGVLLADFCGAEHDFIKEINPEGGKESTGLVTRFTTTRPEGVSAAYPIRLRLLSETDVARVLANTYYADCDHKDAPDADALRAPPWRPWPPAPPPRPCPAA